jgi:hypothetical protein
VAAVLAAAGSKGASAAGGFLANKGHSGMPGWMSPTKNCSPNIFSKSGLSNMPAMAWLAQKKAKKKSPQALNIFVCMRENL